MYSGVGSFVLVALVFLLPQVMAYVYVVLF